MLILLGIIANLTMLFILYWGNPYRQGNRFTLFSNKAFGGDDDGGQEEAEAGIQSAGDRAWEAGRMTPEEEAQYYNSFGTGQTLQDIFNYQIGLGNKPSGYLTGEEMYQRGGPLAQEYYNQTMAGVKSPYAAYESNLQPSLELTNDYINRYYQGKGLIRSGMPIESMGRAGVELSIKEAQDRMRFRGEELARGGELSQYAQGLKQQGVSNLANLYSQQQSSGLQARQRQSGAGQGAAQYWSYPYQAQLGGVYGKQAGNQGLWGQGIGALGKVGMSLPWGDWFGGATSGAGQGGGGSQFQMGASDYLPGAYGSGYGY